MNIRSLKISKCRNGATIIEVIFAIGVLLFGLLGIASMIPVAGRMARSSMNLDRSTTLASRVATQFEAFGFNSTSRWQALDDSGASGSFAPVSAGSVGICLDPLMLARPEVVVPPSVTSFSPRSGWYEPSSLSGHNYYARKWFPYYLQVYNPLVNPMLPQGSADWPAMPRLPRATLSVSRSAAFPSRITSSESQRLIQDSDDLLTIQTEDDTLPVAQMVRSTFADVDVSYTMDPAQRATDGRYTWFATIRPTSFSSGVVSVAVMYNRKRSFELPLSTEPIDSEDPVKANNAGERVTWVETGPGLIDFRGGGGGSIRIVGSQAVSSQLFEGDWVVLIRSVGGSVVHAWYRVLYADQDVELDDSYPDPNSGDARQVWIRNITLDGPDWSFVNAPGSVADDTLAVIVSDVVAVRDFPVSLVP
ncbi:type IV pilus modification PilV family protein [Rosistilla oblonga]|uniref:type IV pilus modification PilV family protein n=1 Tax=Rosistilla oblonga TaxID=2527990 RepID=UPI003A97D8EE